VGRLPVRRRTSRSSSSGLAVVLPIGGVLGPGALDLPPIDGVTALAVVLLLAGVVASAIPNAPGPLLSLGGLTLYWVNSGYARPGPLLFVVLLVLGLVALLIDWLAGPVAARAGEASTSTAVVAGVVGVVGLFLGGPLLAIGLLVVTVFALEFERHEDASAGLRAAVVTACGIVASIGVQVLLTATILVGVVWTAIG